MEKELNNISENEPVNTPLSSIDINKETNGNSEQENDDKVTFTLDDLHTNLVLISKIMPYDKLFINKNLLNIDNRYLQSIIRWYFVESRVRTINFIKSIVDETFNTIDEILKDKEYMTNSSENRDFILQRFTNELKNSIMGLNNLKITYDLDLLIKSQLEVIIENINNKINTCLALFKVQ